MSASITQGPPGAFANMIVAVFALGIRIIGLFFAVLSWVFFVVSIMPYMILALAVSLAMIPWVNYHDTIIENIEFGMRCRIEPFYRTWPRTLLILMRILFDPLVCWYDLVVWYVFFVFCVYASLTRRDRFPFGVTQEIIIPLAIEGGLLDAMSALGNVVAIFLYDFLIRYYATLDILTQPFDYQRTSDAWVAFWPLWQNVICHLCQDLCVFFKLQPVILWHPVLLPIPVVNPLFFLGSNQAGDPQFICAIFETFNGLMALVQPLFQVVVSLLIGQIPPRPDFRRAFTTLCTAVSCLTRSIENSAQFFVDEFLPFPFVFENFFCWADVIACLALKLVDNLIRILIHIDQVIFYPTNDFWLRVAKRDMIEWLNLMAPLNYVAPDAADIINGPAYAFLWPSTQQSVVTPDGTLIINPQFGKLSLAECLALFFERLVCDPTNSSTACFNPMDPSQSILGPFDPGCWIFQAVVTIADVIAGLSEISYHLYNVREFFTFIDRQMTTTIWKEDLVRFVKCVFDVFGIIPVVGACMSRLFTGIVEVILCILDFLIRFVTAFVFLAYYIINDIPCFIIERGRAQLFIKEILDKFADVDDPDSVINCICLYVFSFLLLLLYANTC